MKKRDKTHTCGTCQLHYPKSEQDVEECSNCTIDHDSWQPIDKSNYRRNRLPVSYGYRDEFAELERRSSFNEDYIIRLYDIIEKMQAVIDQDKS